MILLLCIICIMIAIIVVRSIFPDKELPPNGIDYMAKAVPHTQRRNKDDEIVLTQREWDSIQRLRNTVIEDAHR